MFVHKRPFFFLGKGLNHIFASALAYDVHLEALSGAKKIFLDTRLTSELCPSILEEIILVKVPRVLALLLHMNNFFCFLCPVIATDQSLSLK